tara:strand:- start:56231 stop:56566 length:336 start_codon:yes stop_codon:yes gene_type:complete
MGFYLLNISVDTADHNPFDIPEDVSINDQESIVEIVLESVLGYENAIEEYDDSQTDEPITKTTIKIDLIHHRVLYSILHKANDELKTQNFTDYTAYLVKGFGKLDTPPPKN